MQIISFAYLWILMSLSKFSLFSIFFLQFSVLKWAFYYKLGCFFVFMDSIGTQPTAELFEKNLTFCLFLLLECFYGNGKNQRTHYLNFQNTITFDLGQIIEPNQMLWLRIHIILPYIPHRGPWYMYLGPEVPKTSLLGAPFWKFTTWVM